ncbi:hypothetical protein C8A01DRAFT_40937 [Parachaetomium inaequale]|uniref:Uncharacterized protein n=1 Tax=Parachaetomium inaequale TaxID=2588326 RepID=A0AAN6P6E8_9PEZI|nr:hypothetical protein C8A01DRAFT_40937 [Parachaetomium inaequale]
MAQFLQQTVFRWWEERLHRRSIEVLGMLDDEPTRQTAPAEEDAGDSGAEGGPGGPFCSSEHEKFPAAPRTAILERKRPGAWSGWSYLLKAALLAAAFLGGWELAAPPPTSLHEHVLTQDGKSFPSGQLTWAQTFTPLPCGKTPSEAIAQGHFDPIATAWLPPKCIDYELVDEFAALHNWKFYAFPNGTGQYTDDPDTLGSQTAPIWTTRRWHAAHCFITDGETVKQGHTDHCITTILDLADGDPDVVGAILEIIYPPC